MSDGESSGAAAHRSENSGGRRRRRAATRPESGGARPAPVSWRVASSPAVAPPSRRARLLAALAVGSLAGAFLLWCSRGPAWVITDLDQVWYGTRALWQGGDPYAAVGPAGTSFKWDFPLYYPATALVAFGPFALLPLLYARAAFVAVSAALLAYGVTRQTWRGLLLFASGSYLACAALAQWAPLLTAGLLLPWAAALLSAKPNLGLAAIGGAHDRRTLLAAAAGSVVLIAVSLALAPSWPASWIAGMRGATHFTAAIARPGGFLVALALLRWRQWQARLLIAMAVLPLNPSASDLLPLLLVAGTVAESVVLSIGTLLIYVAVARCYPALTFLGCMTRAGALDVWLVYLPCVVMVLRRPNEGAVPAWLERTVALAAVQARAFVARLGRRAA